MLKLFDKKQGRNVPLEEFPSLFTMQAHAGLFGTFFSALWFLTVFYTVPELWSSRLVLIVTAIMFVFIILATTSSSLANYFAMRLSVDDIFYEERRVMDVRARIWMTFLSASYVIIICTLIWLSGGANSPFIPLYVMTFTLTISRTSLPFPGVYVFLYFLMGIIIACVAYEVFQTPINSADMAAIQQSCFQYIIFVFFISASLLAPTLSAYLIDQNPRRKRGRRSKRFS